MLSTLSGEIWIVLKWLKQPKQLKKFKANANECNDKTNKFDTESKNAEHMYDKCSSAVASFWLIQFYCQSHNGENTLNQLKLIWFCVLFAFERVDWT